MKFLYAAYIVTWVILLGYIGIMTLGFKRIEQDLRDLEK